MSSAAELSFEHLPSIVLLVELHSLEIEAANAAARAVFGENAAGADLGAFLPPDELDRLHRRLEGLRPRAAVSGELHVRLGGNRDIPLGYTLRRVDGDVPRLLFVARDLSGSVSSYARLASFFDESSDAIVMWDASGHALEANAAFLRLSRLDREMLRGLNMSELMPLTAAAPEEPFDSSIITAEPAIPVYVTPRLISTDDRTLSAAVVVDQRTLRRREGLERSAIQGQRLEALGRLAAGIAHEFNNMLMAALPWADLIRRKYTDDEVLVRASDHIRRAVHRARDVTRQLLDFAQPRTPEPKVTDMRMLIQQQHKLLRSAIPQEVAVTPIVPQRNVEAYVDGAQISQALLNLGLFAREAVDEDGEIRILLDEGPESELQNGECSITMEWTGDPLTREQQSVLFDPFTPLEEGKGGGLGLSVARRIIEQNRGRVIVSTSARSTALHVVLPCGAPPLEAPALPAEAGEQEIRNSSILIIDDDVDATSGLVPLLEARGARVSVAHTAADGIDLASKAVPEIAIIDARLEGMTIFELTDALRRISPDVLIVAASGWAREDLSLPAGVQYLKKPYDLADLLSRVADLRMENESR